MPAIRAAHAGDALVEDAAIEIAVDRRLHAAAQVAVILLEALLVDEQEAIHGRRMTPTHVLLLQTYESVKLSVRHPSAQSPTIVGNELRYGEATEENTTERAPLPV